MLSVADVEYVVAVVPDPPVISPLDVTYGALTVALYDALRLCAARGSGMRIEYLTGGTTLKVRSIWPVEIEPCRSGADLVFAADSLRDGLPCFRVDRIHRVLAFLPAR